MFASIVSDVFMGLGCVTFTLILLAGCAFMLALKLGWMPGLSEILKNLGKEKPD